MNDDELKNLWRQQPLREPTVPVTQLISAMQKRTTQLRRCLDARDIRELVACAFVIIIFGVFYFTVYRGAVSRLGDLIVIGSTIFIAWKIVHARRSTPPAPPGATVVESLRAELKSTRTQSRLLGSVLWWYILPGFVGVMVATWGLQIDVLAKIFAALIFIAMDAFIYGLNQRARSEQLLPLEAQLESLIYSAETGESLEEAQVASLRPIVLSTATDHVKPAEFKVRAISSAAFWRVALWGEIGFIGIWFFLMLDLTTRREDRKPKGQAEATPTQAVPSGETNRYSVVARKIVDLFNARDYAAVQKLYNLEMSNAFPPKETSDFYTRLAAQFGKIETFDGPTGNGYHGWTAFRLHGERGDLTMSLALDPEDRISGIYFRPLRVFHWQRLIWIAPLIVPFILTGLFYSWLLLKIVELLGVNRRRLGVSTLGIHLGGGETLILWDEIREVRPLRVLHVRSLWLIRDSGKKTLMPWSGLEPHRDLRAAVESFAPANHPIRKYLSLL